jgi:hypothetical protein
MTADKDGVCPDAGRAMRSSPLRRKTHRFGRRHSQPPIEFPCSAPQRDGKSPKTTGNPANVGQDRSRRWRTVETGPDRTGVALGGYPVPLPVATEIDTWLVVHCQRHDAINLRSVCDPPIVLAPCCFLCEPKQVRAGNVVMMSKLAASHPAKEALGLIGVDFMLAAKAVG